MAEHDLFLSTFTGRLDAKGRVSIPAPFRAVLARDGFEGLFVHPSLDGEAIVCGGNDLVSEIQQLINAFPLYSEERDAFEQAFQGMSERLKTDSEGRITLSEACKAHAHIGAEATFVGLGRKFQIWEPGRFLAHRERATSLARDLRKKLGSQIKGAV